MEDYQPSGMKELAEFFETIAMKNLPLEITRIQNTNNERQVAKLPKADGSVALVDLTDYMPKFPGRIQATEKFLEIPSFIGYVNEHKSQHTRIFAQLQNKPFVFKATINYHTAATAEPVAFPADWCDHTASLILQTSQQFDTWSSKSGEWFTQEGFAEFLKDNRLDVFEPNGATLIELVTALEVTATSSLRAKARDNAGMVLQYEDNVQTKVPVPNTLTVGIPLFVGSHPVELLADFKFRHGANGVKFAYRFLGLDAAIRKAVEGVRDQLVQAIELPVYV